jgi:hypothetical protein
MSIIVTQVNLPSSPSSDSTTSAQAVITCASNEIRRVLSDSGADGVLILDWVNEIHKDFLRRTRWVFLKSATQSFTTVSGEDRYFIGTGAAPSGSTDVSLDLTDIFTIAENSVVDRTNYSQIVRVAEKPLGASWVSAGYPKVYRNDSESPTILELYPIPNGAYTIEFRYYKIRNEISSGAQILQVPDTYKDIICAGVSYKAFMYLRQLDEAAIKKQIYETGIRQVINDSNLFPKSNNFIRPAE